MIQKKWFRVETGKDGSVLSCAEVEAKGRSGAVVRFYEAQDAADACSQAKAWADNYRAKRRESSNRRRERLIAAGLCIGCRRAETTNATVCSGCRDRANMQRRQIRNGERLPSIPRLGPEELRLSITEKHSKRTNALRKKYGGGEAYRRMLILRKLDELSPGEAPDFRAWLISTIPNYTQIVDADTHSNWHPPLVIEPMAEAAE